MNSLTLSFRKDKLLWLALVLCFSFSLIGARWGRVEDWNPDQMAFRGVPTNLMVGDYLKPPLTTYAARLLVLNPVDCVMKGILHTSTKLRLETRVMGVRILTILYLCAAVALVYFSILRCNGKTAASAIALIMGTSAGLMAYTHYGTADMPVIFWMMASFACALHAVLSGRLVFGIAAGLLAGLSTACKYNGLGVAIAIPVFLLIQDGPKALLKKNLWLASFAVPVGFVLGCPGALFDHSLFTQDFLYNLYTTPVYGGDTSHPGYGLFLAYIPSIVGWPVTLLLIGAVSISIFLFALKRLRKEEALLLAGTLAVFFFYFLTIGRFPRMEMRFVTPAVPFLLVAAAPALSRINKKFLTVMLVPLIAYNLVCCLFLGWRFLGDPRMGACSWAEKNFKAGDVIESVYAPYWDDLVPGLKVIHIPIFTGRTARFKKIFGNDTVISKGLSKFDHDPSLEIFTREALQKRNPDYVTFSFFAVAFSGDSSVVQYYKDHIAEKLGYHIVWQGTYWLPPRWAYPQPIDFIAPSMYILKRDKTAKRVS
ncbi:MAG: glycosyltransferase family 39 protein [Chthoniobacterales bacterium]|nr:glycosyltransferase family 39 protein [Chthoniobacterales bacterium]